MLSFIQEHTKNIPNWMLASKEFSTDLKEDEEDNL